MNDDTKKMETKFLSSDFSNFKLPLITNEEKFKNLMKDFSEAFEKIESPSGPSLFNVQYFKDFYKEIDNAHTKINKLQNLLEIQAAKFASLFLNIQKNQIYNPILKNLLEIKNKNIIIIEQEIQNRETNIFSMKREHDCTTEELEQLKDEINILQSDTLFSIHEELMRINDSSIDYAHQCISYQNEISKLENDISTIYPLINQKTEIMKSYVVNQSSLRSKLATIGSQINAITTDCAALSIDFENNTKKINQSHINFNQKKLELSTIENEINAHSEKIKDMEMKIHEKEEEIEKYKKNIREIQSKIEETKTNIERIENSETVSINNAHENENTIYTPCIIQLHNKIAELKNNNEQLLSEKEIFDQRNNQLEKIIVKKNQMIDEDKEKINKKQKRFEELQEVFKLRKIMLITAFDDIEHKYDKFYCKIHKLETQIKKECNSRPITIDGKNRLYDSDNENSNNTWNTFNSNFNPKSLYASNFINTNGQIFSQTPQIVRRFSKLFPKSNYLRSDKPLVNDHFFSPNS